MEAYLSILMFTYNFIKYDNTFLQNTTKSKNTNRFLKNTTGKRANTLILAKYHYRKMARLRMARLPFQKKCVDINKF